MPKLLLIFPKSSSDSSITPGWLMVFLIRNTEQKAIFIGCIEKVTNWEKNKIYNVLKLPENDSCYQQTIKDDLLLINPKLDEHIKEVEGSKSNLAKKYKGLKKYLYNSNGTIEIESLPNFLMQLNLGTYQILKVKDFSYCNATDYPITLKPLQNTLAKTSLQNQEINQQEISQNTISTSSDKSILAITKFFDQQNYLTTSSYHSNFFKNYHQDIVGDTYDVIDKITANQKLKLEFLINLINIDYSKKMLLDWIEKKLSFHKSTTEYQAIAISVEKLDKLRNGNLPADKSNMNLSLTKNQLISSFMLFIITKIQNLDPNLFKNFTSEQTQEKTETIIIQPETENNNNQLSKQMLAQ